MDQFFMTNLVLLLFIHGLVFFLMGFAILLQVRHFSELTLARSLPFLGVFGILQAMADWGAFFIPIQAGYLGEGVIRVLQVLDLTLLALSFAALGLFGARLWVDTHDRRRWLVWLPVALFGGWLISFFLFPLVRDEVAYWFWMGTAEFWARFTLGLAGVILAGCGLYAQQHEFKRLGMEQLLFHLEWLIFSLVLFGISFILVGLQHETLTAGGVDAVLEMIHPPTYVLRGVAGLLMMLFTIRLLEVFEIENRRRMNEARQVQMLLDERDRIAKELHDGTMQSLYAVGLRLESSVLLAEGVPDEVRAETREVLAALRAAVAEMRQYVMNLKGSSSHQPLHHRLAALVAEARRSASVPIDYKAASISLDECDESTANHICQIVHEAVSNALRHGRPRHIAVALTRTNEGIQVTVRDDGVGFVVTAESAPGHHGLRHMRQRAQVLGGELKVHSAPGAGTTVQLRVPLKGGAL